MSKEAARPADPFEPACAPVQVGEGDGVGHHRGGERQDEAVRLRVAQQGLRVWKQIPNRARYRRRLAAQDAQAQTVEKRERRNDSQKPALGTRKANAMTASSVSSS